MFKRKKLPQIDPNVTDTLIGEGTVFEGTIKSQAGVRIEGQITGDVECTGDVTIGEGGLAQSNITARNVIVAGTVHGNIMAKESLKLTATGQLFGNATTASFAIEEGAVFHGTSHMEEKQPVAGKNQDKDGAASAEAAASSA